MSEADGKVRIDYEITGIDEASTAQQELEAVLNDVGVVLDRVSEKTDEYAQSTASAAESSDSLTAAAVEAGFKMGEMRERVGNAVGALGTLSSMLGTESDTGAVVGRMAQFGQIGMQVGGVFGPTGAVVGGILGALIPALDELTGGFDGVSESAERAAIAAENASVRMIAAARATREAETAQRNANQDLALAASGDLRERQRASDDAIAVTRAELEAQFGVIADTARSADGARREDAIRRLEIVRGRLREIDIEISEREQMARTQQFAADNPQGPSGDLRMNMSSRRGGGPRPDDSAARAEEARERFRIGLIDAEEDRELARIRRTAEAERRMLDERKEREEALARDLDEFQRESMANRVREEAELLERSESKRLAIKRRQEADTRMWRGTQESMLDATLGGANAIGGAFANAFGAAIQGQEDFGTAFIKGAKQQLLQFGIGQVAEGAGALLSAVGLAFTNPPAAAGKAVEGAGKIALGVSLGAAGAAISTPSAPSAEDKAPRMGPAANEGGGGASIVVNMNSPFVTAGTRAELGRSMVRTIGDSARRFGRAA